MLGMCVCVLYVFLAFINTFSKVLFLFCFCFCLVWFGLFFVFVFFPVFILFIFFWGGGGGERCVCVEGGISHSYVFLSLIGCC